MKKIKLIALCLTGIVLFAASMRFLIDFEQEEAIDKEFSPFIKVKDGYFSYLDSKGYNFQFACEINQILLEESKQIFGEKQIIIESNNSFGITTLIFDKLDSGDIKFSINHQGNLQRDYWFRILLVNNGLKLLKYKPIFVWETGSLDFSDMLQEDSFRLDQKQNKDIFLSVDFNDVVDFYVDPILSETLVLDPINVDRYDIWESDQKYNYSSLYYDTTNTTGWTQWFNDNKQVFGSYSDDLLQNGDFAELYDSSLFDSSVDDDFTDWYSKDGSVSSTNSSLVERGTSDFDEFMNDHLIAYYDLNDNSTDTGTVYIENKAPRDFGTDDTRARFGNVASANWNNSFNTEANFSIEYTSAGSSQYGRIDDSYLYAHFSFNGTGGTDRACSFMSWKYFDENIWDLGLQRYNAIVSRYSTSANDREYRFFLRSDNRMEFALYNYNSDGNRIAVYTQETVSLDTWYHFAATYDGSKTEAGMKIYINGDEVPTSSNSAGTYTGQTFQVTRTNFGGSTLNGYGGDGLQDEIMIFDDVVQAELVESIYDQSPFHNEASFGTLYPSEDRALDVQFNLEDRDYLKNGFLESGDDGNWTTEYSGGTYTGITTASDRRHSGSYGMGVAYITGSYRTSWIWQTVFIDSEQLTEVSGWWKSLNGNVYANITLFFTDDTTHTQSWGAITSTWTKYTLTLANVPKGKFINKIEFREHYLVAGTNYGAMDDFTVSVSEPKAVYDRSNYAINGSYVNSPSWESSYNAQANNSLRLTKNGATEYVFFADQTHYSFTDGSIDLAFSISLWIYIVVDPTTDIIFIQKANSTANEFEWQLGANRTASNTFYPFFKLMNNSVELDFIRTQSQTSISTGSWNFLYATYNGNSSQNGLNLYLNGSLLNQDRSINNTYITMQNTNASLMIGSNSVNQSIRLDSVRVYDFEHGAGRISTIYQIDPTNPAYNNTDGGRFSSNIRFAELEASESLSQDIRLDSDNLVNILFDSLLAGYDNISLGLLVTLYYSDGSNSTQMFANLGDGNWYGNISYNMLGKQEFTNISSSKTIISINFNNTALERNCFIDNVEFNYTIDSVFHGESSYAWIPTGLEEYNVTGTTQQRNYFFFHRNDTNYLTSGMYINNSMMNFNENSVWSIDVNLTFHAFSNFWNDYSFAGGIQIHFLNATNNSIAYVDLRDNSTSSGSHEIGGSLFYNTSSTTGVYAKDYEFDTSNYNLTAEFLRIKKVDNYIFVNYPESLAFGGEWLKIATVSEIFQVDSPASMGILFYRNASSRPINYPDMNSTLKTYYVNGSDYSEDYSTATPNNYSRSILSTPMYISSFNFTYHDTLVNNESNVVIGDRYAYLTNGSNQVIYEFNYSINVPASNEIWHYHNHTFLMPNNYTFINTTFGDGTVKTIEEGFTKTSFNGTHDQFDYEDEVNGTFTWFFLTGNSINYFALNPDQTNGTLTNQSYVEYFVRVTNGSTGLENYPVDISVVWSDEALQFTESKVTGSDGWLNSSFDQQLDMSSDNKFYVKVEGLNQTFMGYAVKYYLAYNDWNAPVVSQLVFNDTVYSGETWNLDVYLSDNWTPLEEVTVLMEFSFVSSISFDEQSYLNYQLGKFSAVIIGQDAGETMWFKLTCTDNLTNQYVTITYQVDWVEPPTEQEGAPAGDGDGAAPVTPSAAPTPDLAIILVFLAGAVMVAVLGYAVFRRVTVRTRRVETREVITALGRAGQTKETIEEKGG